ncbi:SPOR domain-containing protein [Eudoraea chungangensis]|uniref:HU domain-containing protein n=1 Tax=Eudoraea chungangensis TaxID=1481905 RepID=UPI0023ED94A0|nr:SPOR domain-containing protein [Eudoraea chungangensis]
MAIEYYIEQLLYRYNCVVVPNFGAFLTNRKSAVIDSVGKTFYPPTKQISFNEQLNSNDGLLISFMAESQGKSYEEALEVVTTASKSWDKNLRSGNKILLDSIGSLWINKEGKIQFEPSNKLNFLPSSFGLSSFISSPINREHYKEEVEKLEENIPFIITPERRQKQSFRPYIKYAAILLLAFSTGLTAYLAYNKLGSNELMVKQGAQNIVSKNIQEATFFNTDPLEFPVLELPIIKKTTGNHHIIAGAFRIKENADKKMAQLRVKGYNASYLGVNKYGLHQVAYDSFERPEEALKRLREIKQTDSPDAWLLSVK